MLENLKEVLEAKLTGNESKNVEEIIEKSKKILTALGDKENIKNINACFTRLRVDIYDMRNVDIEALKSIGASDVLEVSDGVQAIYGGDSIIYKNCIDELLKISMKSEQLNGEEPNMRIFNI